MLAKRLPFKSWEQQKIARNEIGLVGTAEGGHNHHLFLSRKGGVLLTLQRFNENRWRPLTAFMLKILDKVSSDGRGAEIAVSSHRGSSAKGTEISNLYDCFH
jgi:hypothetical protein